MFFLKKLVSVFPKKEGKNAGGVEVAEAVDSVEDSVIFYTLHKCASTLFSSFVLPNTPGLKHVDYADDIWNGRDTGPLDFSEKGCIYGPVRLSASWASPDFLRLNTPATEPGFLASRRGLFFIRDPRDILVSAFYSFSRSHVFSPVPHITEFHALERKRIQPLTVDQYCLEKAPVLAAEFRLLTSLHKSCPRSLLLRYEEMIDDFPAFRGKMSAFLHYPPEILDEIHRRSRPREEENLNAHQRSGVVRGFCNKVKTETALQLDEIFRDVLEEFDYPSSEALYGNE
jgi:hypothetical protein